MTTLRRTLLCLAALAMASPVAAQVRDFNSAAELYGRGVHAYYDGRTAEAEELFSLALAENASDPRILYFRAMTLLRLGRTEEAKGDMVVGAALEAQHPDRYAVGSALARVQGGDRLFLERFRQQARTRAAANGRPALDAQSDEAAGVLRSRVVLPLDEILLPGGPRPLTADEISRRAAAIENARAAAVAPPVQPPTRAADPLSGADSAAVPAAEESEISAQPAESSEEAEATAEETTDTNPPPLTAPAGEEPADSETDPFGDIVE
jgi:hypothetical protein